MSEDPDITKTRPDHTYISLFSNPRGLSRDVYAHVSISCSVYTDITSKQVSSFVFSVTTLIGRCGCEMGRGQ